ncbi:hypothetical protein Bca52824_017705 [Brassica carinata]|uniref:Prepilin-type N-terminal cleavage/methylation domain-containing protein n=1 Tax=Brassica carinata TaxID=52824 RepID=A0A8X7VML1_BRACI|nr:hypothetical protein Bca52824_017705 [Brassica carinata]
MRRPDLIEKRDRFLWCVLLLGVERHSEALSDGVQGGLSLVELVLALFVVELAIMCSSRRGDDFIGLERDIRFVISSESLSLLVSSYMSAAASSALSEMPVSSVSSETVALHRSWIRRCVRVNGNIEGLVLDHCDLVRAEIPYEGEHMSLFIITIRV